MPGFHLASAAVVDADEIFDYLHHRNPAAAVRFFQRFDVLLLQIARHPQLGTRVEKLSRGLRFFPFGSYLVFYRSGSDCIEIVRFLHSARDIRPDFFGE